jgi:hypothetical protein
MRYARRVRGVMRPRNFRDADAADTAATDLLPVAPPYYYY